MNTQNWFSPVGVNVIVTNDPKRCVRYLNKFSQSIYQIIHHPENWMNGKELRQYAKEVVKQNIYTGSLFLLREFSLSQRTDIQYTNVLFEPGNPDPQVFHSKELDTLQHIEILDRELEQYDRYVNASFA